MSRKLRALFVTSSARPGGAERQSMTLMNRLVERGHDCRMLAVKQAEDGARLACGAAAQSLGATRYLDWAAIRRFGAALAAAKPSIVVAVNPYALMYATLALPSSGQRPRLAVTYHTTRLLGVKERLQTIVYRPLFWNADCTIFVCAAQRRYWRRRAVLSRRDEVIYNGVDTSAYRDSPSAPERTRRRRALGFEDADYIIGISAWLRPEKNHVQLVDALAKLRRRGVPARALMIGDGETRGTVERRARDLGLDAHVVITGAQTDVRPFVAICDVMAICSVAVETFSLAALEAMAMAKPVVHSDLGGASEMIMCGRNGFIFPVGDTDALVARLAELSDRSSARRIGANARALVEARFSETRMVDRYEGLLLELCDRAAARHGSRSREGTQP